VRRRERGERERGRQRRDIRGIDDLILLGLGGLYHDRLSHERSARESECFLHTLFVVKLNISEAVYTHRKREM
jgi:hypothetical protein